MHRRHFPWYSCMYTVYMFAIDRVPNTSLFRLECVLSLVLKYISSIKRHNTEIAVFPKRHIGSCKRLLPDV